MEPIGFTADEKNVPWSECVVVLASGSLRVEQKDAAAIQIPLISATSKLLYPLLDTAGSSGIGVEVFDQHHQVLIKFPSTRDCVYFMTALSEYSVLLLAPLAMLKEMFNWSERLKAHSERGGVVTTLPSASELQTVKSESVTASIQELESILLSLNLPPTYPTLAVVRELNQKLMKMNAENHSLLNIYLTDSMSGFPSVEALESTDAIDQRENVAVPNQPIEDQTMDLNFLVPSKRMSEIKSVNLSMRRSIAAIGSNVSEVDRDVCSKIVGFIRSDAIFACELAKSLDAEVCTMNISWLLTLYIFSNEYCIKGCGRIC